MRFCPALVALAASVLMAGCMGAHFEAAYPQPDFVSQRRSTHSFQIAMTPAGNPDTMCTGRICVDALRAQMERGIVDALDPLAERRAVGVDAEYIGRLTVLTFYARAVSSRGLAPDVDLALHWRFTLVDARTQREIVNVGETETALIPRGNDLRGRLQQLEHAALTRIEDAVARSELTDP